MKQPEALAIDPEVMAVAEAQAAKDRDLVAHLADLKTATEQVRDTRQEVIDVEENEDIEPAPRYVMNRRERRQQVQFYANLLAQTERQVPTRNATIIPRSERRRQKQQRSRK